MRLLITPLLIILIFAGKLELDTKYDSTTNEEKPCFLKMTFSFTVDEAIISSSWWKESKDGDWVYTTGGEWGFGTDDNDHAYTCETENKSTDDGPKNMKC